MLEEEVAARRGAAIHAFVVAQDVLNAVQAGWGVLAVLAAVTAHDLHAKPAGDDLALVSVFVACVLGLGVGVVLELAPLVAALGVDFDRWTARS